MTSRKTQASATWKTVGFTNSAYSAINSNNLSLLLAITLVTWETLNEQKKHVMHCYAKDWEKCSWNNIQVEETNLSVELAGWSVASSESWPVCKTPQ